MPLGVDQKTAQAANDTAAQILTKLLTVDGAASGLDADLLDGKNTGTSGNAVPLLDGVNTWSGAQNWPDGCSFISTDAGAGVGPTLNLSRNSASPIANDVIGAFRFWGLDDSAAACLYAEMGGIIDDPTNTLEDGHFRARVMQAGTLTSALEIGLGVIVGAPTGSFNGQGTLNATEVYNDDVALTCFALSEEFRKSRTIDLKKWDGLVPDRKHPESREQRPVMVPTGKMMVSVKRAPNGTYVAIDSGKPELVQLKEWNVLHDNEGNWLDYFEEPVFEEVVTPERIEKRTHKIARLFKAMCDEGFDPSDPAQYIALMKADRALPGMPTEAEWATRGHNKIGTGELFMRHWLASEMLVLAFEGLCKRVDAIQAKAAK